VEKLSIPVALHAPEAFKCLYYIMYFWRVSVSLSNTSVIKKRAKQKHIPLMSLAGKDWTNTKENTEHLEWTSFLAAR